MDLFTIFCIICYQESGANPNAIGDNGRAKGIVQIHQGVVDDVNVFSRWDVAHDACFDVCWSWQIFRSYMKRWAKKPYTLEECARIWNGGPNGKANTEYVKACAKLAPSRSKIIALMTKE